MENKERLRFYGGPTASLVPLIVFVGVTVVLVAQHAPTEPGLILAAMLGMSLGMVLARDRAAYTEAIFSLMANRTATVAVACWLWAGAFSGVMADSGLVEAVAWCGWKIGLTGRAFAVVTFVSAALFAVSVGTGLGTVIGFTTIMYPAGIVLNAEPAALMGAIISGAAFGDNLAPVSDTTIVSAATQEVDVGGVVASRLKYVMPAAAVSAVLFWVFGAGERSVNAEQAQRILEATADPRGLPMLLSAVVVFVLAIALRNIIIALTAGIVTAAVLGPLVGVFAWSDLVHVTPAGAVAGSLVSGAMGLVPISVLTLLMVAIIGIMNEAGFLSRLMAWLTGAFARSARGAEGVIVVLISFANLCVSVNTVAMIATGPLVNELRKRRGIHGYRAANLLDTVSCSFPYLLPYAAVMFAGSAIQKQLAANYDFVPVVPWTHAAMYSFYPLLLFPLMIVAVWTRYGAKSG